MKFIEQLGAKVTLTGSNGTGETTLIQMILNHEDGIFISPKAKISYFAQNRLINDKHVKSTLKKNVFGMLISFIEPYEILMFTDLKFVFIVYNIR